MIRTTGTATTGTATTGTATTGTATTAAARPGRRRRTVLAGALAAASLVLAGCGLNSASSFTPAADPGSIEPISSAEGVGISVGSKNFTEQLVLGKIAVIALRTAGFDVTDRTNIPGSQPAREAQLQGEVDMEWEYNGTAWIAYMGNAKPIVGDQAQYEAVRKADLENGLTWLPPAPMNDTYAFAYRAGAADELGNITDLSGLKDLPVDQRTLCVESEFASRPDGLPGMLEAYGLKLGDPDGIPRGNVKVLDTGAVYSATAEGRLCNFGEVFTTDGRIIALDLTVLEDPEKFFPSYNVSPVVRTETLEAHPEIKDVFDQISPELTNDVMLDLNAKVDVDGQDPADVAYDWMVSEGFVS